MSNRVRVQQIPHGTDTISLPRALVQVFRMKKGNVMEWVEVEVEGSEDGLVVGHGLVGLRIALHGECQGGL